MPVLIPLAINIGFYIEYLIREFKTIKDKKETIPVYFQFGLIGTIALLFWVSGFFLGIDFTGFILVRFIVSSIVLAVIGFFIFKYLKAKNIKVTFYLSIAFMLCIGLLSLPLAKYQSQENYNPISKISSDNISLYTLDGVSPELIYNYGDKIESIKTNEGIIIPEEKQFRLLTTTSKPEEIEELSKLYKIEFVETFDLNFSSRDYKSRLVNQLYMLTRK